MRLTEAGGGLTSCWDNGRGGPDQKAFIQPAPAHFTLSFYYYLPNEATLGPLKRSPGFLQLGQSRDQMASHVNTLAASSELAPLSSILVTSALPEDSENASNTI